MGRLLDHLQRQIRDRPGRTAIDSRARGSAVARRRLDFAALDTEIEAWRDRLARARGSDGRLALGPDRPTAVALQNGVAFPAVVFALRRLGVPVVSVDASLSLEDRLSLCRGLGVTRLVHRSVDDPDDVERIRLVAGAPDGPVLDLLPGEPVQPPAGTAVVKLTSGSTGSPNGVCYDDDALVVGIEQIAAGMEITADDRVLLTVPLSHSYGFDNGLLSLAVVGTPLVLQHDIFPQQVRRAVCESEATVLPLVPPLVRALGDSPWPPHRLRRVLCAGGKLPAEAARAFHAAAGVPVHDFYGSSETGGICFETDPLDPAAAGTVGRPLPGVDLRLDPCGRVVVDSAACRIAAWGDRERWTDRSVRPGDLGEIGADGRLRLVGRSADVLNIGCRKVPAARVEGALRALDGVRDAAVVGVPDAMRGDRVVAFLVADEWPIALRGLPSGLVPREVRRVEALPFTARGKLDRAALRSLATTPSADPAGEHRATQCVMDRRAAPSSA